MVREEAIPRADYRGKEVEVELRYCTPSEDTSFFESPAASQAAASFNVGATALGYEAYCIRFPVRDEERRKG